MIASLVETCKLCGVDPQAYLADVLTRIVNGHRARDIDDLLPWAHAEARRSTTRPEDSAYSVSNTDLDVV